MGKVLIVTNYFPPETGAASNRIFHLAEGLCKKNLEVRVVTPLPNYPTGRIFEAYRGKFKDESIDNGIKISRLWVYASNSKNKLLRLIAMLSYSLSLSWFFLSNKIPKTVIVQSPPLIVAFTCMLLLSNKRQLILNVSDLWPIAGLELGAFKKNFSYRVLERIERYNYRKATIILGQSQEILTHVSGIVPNKKTLLYRNYPNFRTPEPVEQDKVASGKLKIVYAGLLGIAQGIYKLCQNLDYSNIEFHIYGNGAEAHLIEQFIASNEDLPIYYHGESERSELHVALMQYDLTIIPLLNRIYGSVPSKIFEYAKLGLPMLYFGGGEGEDIILKHDLGWVAESSNYKDLNNKLNSIQKDELHLSFRKNIQEVAQREFDLGSQIDSLSELLQR